MTTLYLVRHGETVENVQKVMQGQTPGTLSELGEQQAAHLCEQFCSEAIDMFFSSDLQRAVQTCACIAAPHQAVVHQTPLLRERDWGDFTGCYIPDLKDKPFPDNVESIEALKQRAAAFLEEVRRRCPSGTVLAVGHGIINKAIQSVFYRLPMSEIARMNNAEVRKLQL